MNKTKKIIIIIWLLLIVICCIYPPWQIAGNSDPIGHLGYHPLWWGLELFRRFPTGAIFSEILILEIIIVTALCGAVWFFTDIIK
jgi:hypothetical protein